MSWDRLKLVAVITFIIHWLVVYGVANAMPESEIDYLAVPEVSNKDKAAQRDAFYDGYREAGEDCNAKAKGIVVQSYDEGFKTGWCDAIDNMNELSGRIVIKDEGCE